MGLPVRMVLPIPLNRTRRVRLAAPDGYDASDPTGAIWRCAVSDESLSLVRQVLPARFLQ